jgi:hypothetical protein
MAKIHVHQNLVYFVGGLEQLDLELVHVVCYLKKNHSETKMVGSKDALNAKKNFLEHTITNWCIAVCGTSPY